MQSQAYSGKSCDRAPRSNQLQENAHQDGDEREAAVLDFLDLELGEDLGVVSQAQGVEWAACTHMPVINLGHPDAEAGGQVQPLLNCSKPAPVSCMQDSAEEDIVCTSASCNFPVLQLLCMVFLLRHASRVTPCQELVWSHTWVEVVEAVEDAGVELADAWGVPRWSSAFFPAQTHNSLPTASVTGAHQPSH